MPNILFLAPEDVPAQDLEEQIKTYAPEFNVFRKDEENVMFDLIIIDENIHHLKSYMEKFPQRPLFLLSSSEAHRKNAIVITKPFRLPDLLDQIKAAIQLHENSSEGYLSFNQYELHPTAKEILNLRNNQLVKLTEKEVAVIKYLYKAGNRIVSRQELLQDVWEYSPEVSTHTIETHIYRLRQKVEQDNPDAQMILTTDGGYRLKGLD